MKRRILALLLVVLFLIPLNVASFAVNPTSLEAPKSVTARMESADEIMLRWTVPQSVMAYLDPGDNDILYYIDWKINNGPWHNDGTVNQAVLEQESKQYFFGSIGGIVTDENNGQEVFFVYFHFDVDSIDFTQNTYTFRMRFAYDDYDQDGENFILSPWSNETSVGKDAANVTLPKTFDAPLNLKVETKTDINGKPYFYLNWANPASVDKFNLSIPIEFKIDYKVGSGKWFSEEHTQEWWGSEDYATHTNFDPVEKYKAESVVIEKNTYYFRILYCYEPTEGAKIYSNYSNIVQAGVPQFENYTPWAMSDLIDGAELGIITDAIKGQMNGPITREEFAAVAVKFYEVVTGNTAVPHPTKTFTDCTNPEVLKAFNLGIIFGVGDGTKFEPKSPLIRQQMAVMITRTIKACYPDVVFDVTGQPDFKDQSLILKNFGISTKFMAKYKITVADSKGNFNPDNACTREQAVAFLVRAYNYKDQYLPK